MKTFIRVWMKKKEKKVVYWLLIKKSKDNRTRQAMRSFRLNRKEKLGQCFFNSNHFINISKIDILSFLFVYTFFLFILRERKEKHTFLFIRIPNHQELTNFGHKIDFLLCFNGFFPFLINDELGSFQDSDRVFLSCIRDFM